MSESAAASRRAAAGLAALGGLAAFLLIHLYLRVAWDTVFAEHPWPGYEQEMRSGTVEPWFVHSPRSLWLTRAALFALALGIAIVKKRGRWTTGVALWSGAAAGIMLTYATTTIRSLPWGWLGFLLYPFRVLLPILLGTALGELARRTILRPGRV